MAEKSEMFCTRIVLDVLKPHRPSIIELGEVLSKLNGVDRVNILLQEVDVDTETVKVTIEGSDVHYGKLKETISRNGGVVHSIDEILILRKPTV